MARSIIAAAMGLLLGGALVAGLGLAGVHSLWPALAVAIAIGLLVRKTAAGGANAYARGALAAAALLLAVAGGKVGAAAYLLTTTPSQTIGSQEPLTSLPIAYPRPSQTSDAASGDAPQERLNLSPLASASARARGPAAATTFSLADAVLMAVSALLAYELGKGSAAHKTPATPQEPASDRQMAG